MVIFSRPNESGGLHEVGPARHTTRLCEITSREWRPRSQAALFSLPSLLSLAHGRFVAVRGCSPLFSRVISVEKGGPRRTTFDVLGPRIDYT